MKKLATSITDLFMTAVANHYYNIYIHDPNFFSPFFECLIKV